MIEPYVSPEGHGPPEVRCEWKPVPNSAFDLAYILFERGCCLMRSHLVRYTC